jgi:hypothetical protein
MKSLMPSAKIIGNEMAKWQWRMKYRESPKLGENENISCGAMAKMAISAAKSISKSQSRRQYGALMKKRHGWPYWLISIEERK